MPEHIPAGLPGQIPDPNIPDPTAPRHDEEDVNFDIVDQQPKHDEGSYGEKQSQKEIHRFLKGMV